MLQGYVRFPFCIQVGYLCLVVSLLHFRPNVEGVVLNFPNEMSYQHPRVLRSIRSDYPVSESSFWQVLVVYQQLRRAELCDIVFAHVAGAQYSHYV